MCDDSQRTDAKPKPPVFGDGVTVIPRNRTCRKCGSTDWVYFPRGSSDDCPAYWACAGEDCDETEDD